MHTRWLIVVNLSDGTATGRVRAPWQDLRGHRWQLVDPTQDVSFDRDGDDLVDGLYVELDAWHWHLLRIDPAPVPLDRRLNPMVSRAQEGVSWPR